MKRIRRSYDLFEDDLASNVPRVLVFSCRNWAFIARGISSTSKSAIVSNKRIVALTPAARKLGVSLGDRVQSVLAQSSELQLIEMDTQFDLFEFEKVVSVMEEFCPEVEVFAPGLCGFNMRGPTRYFGGEQSLLKQVALSLSKFEIDSHTAVGSWFSKSPQRYFTSSVIERFDRLNGEVDPCIGGWYSLGVGEGIFSARLASQYGVVIKPGMTREFMAGFPIEIFGEGPDIDTLRGSGAVKVSDIVGMPRHLLIERFGSFGKKIYNLGIGIDSSSIRKRQSTDLHSIRIEFDPPSYLAETIVFSMRSRVDQLFSDLAKEGLYPLRVRVVFETESVEMISRIWVSDVPISTTFLLNWSRWQLDAWTQPGTSTSREPPNSGVIFCDITVLDTTANPSTQLDLYSLSIHPQDRVLRSIERAKAKLKEGAIKVPKASSGRSPKDQFQLVPWQIGLFDEYTKEDVRKNNDIPWPGKLPNPAPSLVFDPLVPIDVLDHNGSQVAVNGGGEFSGMPETIIAVSVFDTPKKLRQVLGPWQTTQRWWDSRSSRRLARVQVVSEDGIAMVILIENSKWFLEAVYD